MVFENYSHHGPDLLDGEFYLGILYNLYYYRRRMQMSPYEYVVF